MEILVRKYTKNGDKSNKKVEGIDVALKAIGRTVAQTKQIVCWLNYVDIFFEGTDNYIRVIN